MSIYHIYSFIIWWTYELFPICGYYKSWYYEYSYVSFFVHKLSFTLNIYQRTNLLGNMVTLLAYLHVLIGYLLFSHIFWKDVLRAAPVAYGSSQPRGLIGAAAAGLCHSHSHSIMGSEPHLQPTPRLTESHLTHWARPVIKPTSSWILICLLLLSHNGNSRNFSKGEVLFTPVILSDALMSPSCQTFFRNLFYTLIIWKL